MDLEILDDVEHAPQSGASDQRRGIGPVGIVLKLIAGATIACSFIQVLRGDCTPITVIQFWLSLFVAAIAQSAAGDRRSDAVEVNLGRGESRPN
jgi:hypothetical protein